MYMDKNVGNTRGWFIFCLFIFFIFVLAGVILAEYNYNSLLGVDSPIRVIGFKQPEAATYCITAFGTEYSLCKVIEYGQFNLSKDKIVLTIYGQPFSIPIRFRLTTMEEIINFFNRFRPENG